MFVLCIPKPLSIVDLQANKNLLGRLRSPTELRAAIKIAVIDDQPFAPEHNLKNNQFQISTFKDVKSVKEVEEYPIVLCDLQGVGVQLAADGQGAFLIEEIKRNYPEKAVVAFTGGSAVSSISKRAFAAADDTLRKDASIDEWREILDRHIKNLSDPVYIWKQLRTRLIRADVTPIELMKLEHAYVSSIKDGATKTKNALQDVANSGDTGPHVKREVVGFLASKAFDLVFQALAS